MQEVLTFVLMLLFNFYVKRAPIEFEKASICSFLALAK